MIPRICRCCGQPIAQPLIKNVPNPNLCLPCSHLVSAPEGEAETSLAEAKTALPREPVDQPRITG